MKNTFPIFLLFLFGLIFQSNLVHTQEREEGNAEISNEVNSDDFQEAFFEALKQKAIGNNDKAVNLLLRCKEISPENEVVDYELAKAYMDEGNFDLAEEFALNALNAKPENIWYLNTLVEVLPKLGNTIEGIKSKIPYGNMQFRENLALIYYWQGNYGGALKILEGVKTTAATENLMLKINDSVVEKQNIKPIPVEERKTASPNEPLQSYISQIEKLLVLQDYNALETISSSALESFPTQPFLYYAHGVALIKTLQYNKAVETLESALDYLLDDTDLNNKIYKQLSIAYSALGNSSKANMYLSKIKTRS